MSRHCLNCGAVNAANNCDRIPMIDPEGVAGLASPDIVRLVLEDLIGNPDVVDDVLADLDRGLGVTVSPLLSGGGAAAPRRYGRPWCFGLPAVEEATDRAWLDVLRLAGQGECPDA